MDYPPPLPDTAEQRQRIPPTDPWRDETNRRELRGARNEGCLIGCLASVALFFVFTVVVPVVLIGVVARTATRELSTVRAQNLFGGDKQDEDRGFTGDAAGLREVAINDYIPPDAKDTSATAHLAKAIRIPLVGTIDLDSDRFGEEGDTATALRSIRRATEDDTVDAILLLVDSGGGGITASDILYEALLTFRESREDRRIVVLMGDMACSGAYYASLPADRIIAHPTTITGSIGVILQSINAYRLAERLGIVDDSIESGANKGILNPLRELTPEQRALLQGTVDELHARFTSLVAKHPDIPPAEVSALADGRIYTARQALDLKLIDGLGYLADAEEVVEKLLDTDNGVTFYEYEHKLSLRDLLATPSFWGAALQRALPAAFEAVPVRPRAK